MRKLLLCLTLPLCAFSSAINTSVQCKTALATINATTECSEAGIGTQNAGSAMATVNGSYSISNGVVTVSSMSESFDIASANTFPGPVTFDNNSKTTETILFLFYVAGTGSGTMTITQNNTLAASGGAYAGYSWSVGNQSLSCAWGTFGCMSETGSQSFTVQLGQDYAFQATVETSADSSDYQGEGIVGLGMSIAFSQNSTPVSVYSEVPEPGIGGILTIGFLAVLYRVRS